MTETRTLKIKNGETEFIKFGKGKKTLVVLPGLSYDGFFPQAETIAQSYGIFTEDFTVYLIDRNLSPKTGYTVRDIADDTTEVLSKLGVNKADFFGASLGGMVAQEIAINYPKFVNKLVLGSTLSRPNETFLNTLSQWETLATSKDLNSLFDDMNKKIYSPYTLKKYAAIFAMMKPKTTEEKTTRLIAYIDAAKGFNVYNSLDKITAETLVISASKDKITTVNGAREIAEKLNCRYHEYRKYGHAVFDEAKCYKQRIYNFLTK